MQGLSSSRQGVTLGLNRCRPIHHLAFPRLASRPFCSSSQHSIQSLSSSTGPQAARATSGASRRMPPARSMAGDSAGNSSSDYGRLRGATVRDAASGQTFELTSLWQAAPGTKVVVAFMTHFADLSSWEYAQKLVRALPLLEASGVQLIAVGLGSCSNAQEFSRIHNFPLSQLYADETGACYSALGFSAGFRPAQLQNVSSYVRLLPMLMGIGSPGTLQEVIRGYVGDRNSKPVWDKPTPFDILGSGYQRPFELATLRLSNMVGILPKWGMLCPPDEELLTQQGGTVAFRGEETTFRHADRGILDYCNMDALLQSVMPAEVVVGTSVVRP